MANASGRYVWIAAALLGFAGSLWAWLAGPACASCHGAAGALGPFNLAAVGIGAYAALVAFTIAGRTEFSARGVYFAAGSHALLLALLLSLRLACIPCIATGSAVLLAAVIGMLIHAVSRETAIRWSAIGMVITAAIVLPLVRREANRRERAAIDAARELMRIEPRPAAGRATVIVLTRAGCRYCEAFEAGALAETRRSRAADASVETRAAPVGVPTPTTLVLGVRCFMFTGNHVAADLLQLLDMAEGRVGGAPPRWAVELP